MLVKISFEIFLEVIGYDFILEKKLVFVFFELNEYMLLNFLECY